MRRQIHLLIAEDDEEDREILRDAIMEVAPDRSVRFAKNGQDLMEQLEYMVPDLIFLDINMPLKTGMECLQEIRQNKNYYNLPVLIYSTTASPQFIEMAYHAGANLFIQKPSNYSELKKLLSKVMNLDLDKFHPKPERMRFYFNAISD